MNKGILVTAVSAALALVTTSANAIEAKVSGQITRALMYVDDGFDKVTHHVDNDISGSRFRFTGSAELMPGVKGGVYWEMGYQSNSSSRVTQTVRSVTPTLDERHQHIYLDGSFGILSLGQGDGAANGGTEVDLSGTGIINSAFVGELGAAVFYRVSGTGATVAGATVGGTMSQQDFESRYDRVLYTSPVLGPFKVTVSHGQKAERNVKEVAGWYNGDLGGLGKLAAAVGVSQEDTADIGFDNETIGGSVSWLMPMGLNVTVSVSNSEVATNREGEFRYVKVGYKTGPHSIAVDYGMADDLAAQGDEATVMGVGYVFSPKPWAELYAGAKLHKLDRVGVSFEDIKVVTGGGRFKF